MGFFSLCCAGMSVQRQNRLAMKRRLTAVWTYLEHLIRPYVAIQKKHPRMRVFFVVACLNLIQLSYSQPSIASSVIMNVPVLSCNTVPAGMLQ